MPASFVLSLALLAPSAAPLTQPTWVVEAGLSGEQLKKRTEGLGRRGFRPLSVCGYNAGEENRFAAIWAKGGDGEWRMDYGLTRKGLTARVEDLTGRGYRLAGLSGYDLIGAERFADVWVKAKGPAWEWLVGVDQKALAGTLTDMKKRGYRPTRVSAYSTNGANAYALLGEKGGDVRWELSWGLSARQLQDALDDFKTRGYRPVSVAGLTAGTGARYALIWERRRGPAWVLRYGEDQDTFTQTARAMAARGYRPVEVAGYNTLEGDRFASIWERE